MNAPSCSTIPTVTNNLFKTKTSIPSDFVQVKIEYGRGKLYGQNQTHKHMKLLIKKTTQIGAFRKFAFDKMIEKEGIEGLAEKFSCHLFYANKLVVGNEGMTIGELMEKSGVNELTELIVFKLIAAESF